MRLCGKPGRLFCKAFRIASPVKDCSHSLCKCCMPYDPFSACWRLHAKNWCPSLSNGIFSSFNQAWIRLQKWHWQIDRSKCNMGNTKCLWLMADGPKNKFALSASIAPEHQSITHKLQWGTSVTMITVNARVPKRIHQNVSPGSQCFDPENWASWNRYVGT